MRQRGLTRAASTCMPARSAADLSWLHAEGHLAERLRIKLLPDPPKPLRPLFDAEIRRLVMFRPRVRVDDVDLRTEGDWSLTSTSARWGDIGCWRAGLVLERVLETGSRGRLFAILTSPFRDVHSLLSGCFLSTSTQRNESRKRICRTTHATTDRADDRRLRATSHTAGCAQPQRDSRHGGIRRTCSGVPDSRPSLPLPRGPNEHRGCRSLDWFAVQATSTPIRYSTVLRRHCSCQTPGTPSNS